MSESIPDVILRLARRHMPVDATVPVSPARPDIEPADPPIDAPTPLPREPQGAAVDEHVSTASGEPRRATVSSDHESIAAASNPHPFAADPSYAGSLDHPDVQSEQRNESADAPPQFVVQASRLPSTDKSRRAGRPQPAPTPHVPEPYPPASDAESFASESDPAFERPDIPTPSSAFGIEPPRRPGYPAGGFADNFFQPAGRSATNAGSSRDQSQNESASESSRQLEQTARDLETSLTHLFTTQIETLQRLRDRIDEHERRWVEQQGARRATF